MAKLRVCVFTPDDTPYDGTTADRGGVGGGVTARIRLAAALAGLGHDVTAVCACPRPGTFAGVRYVPGAQLQPLEVDVLVVNSSRQPLDVSPAAEAPIRARLPVLWLQGAARPAGIDALRPRSVVAPSEFIRGVAVDDWGISPEQMYIAHNGVLDPAPRPLLARLRSRSPRDPHRLVYTGHPSKGLRAATQVLRRLRAKDPRFELHVFGGAELWGGAREEGGDEPGLVHHGMVGQTELREELLRASVALCLQHRPEPFGIALAEAMAAGCIVIASPVGAYTELVTHGFNGFLVPGDHNAKETHALVARLVLHLAASRGASDHIRRNAQPSPLRWREVARGLAAHWGWMLSGAPPPTAQQRSWLAQCEGCGSAPLTFADGYHCPGCGRFSRSSPPVPAVRPSASAEQATHETAPG